MAGARSRLKRRGSSPCLAAAKLCVVLATALASAGCAAHAKSGGGGGGGGGGGTGGNGTKALAAAYMAIALPVNHRLDKEVDSYNDHARDDLAVADADLRQEVATERGFDQRLLEIAFPSAIAATARALVRVNDQRIALTTEQARMMTLSGLLAFNAWHRAADAAVEAQVRIIRKQLGLPPPDNS
jgi:hypothetical protein